MDATTRRVVAAAALGVLALAGCGGGEEEDDAAGAAAPAGDAVLATADSELGEIVVDGEGRAVYVFDRDAPGSGSSSCADSCAESWPPVTAEAEAPEVDGVTGDVGTIERDDGTRQVTVGGLPLYTYAGDSDAGDVTGQGVQGVWWVVAPHGAKISEAAPSSADTAY
ncbi:putative lipoprotein with Yx(FWY)xxD motif [Blastococcus colisei]|uniref:Putative lipoprotein with Yx(FWY)xxD motif n=1 Tax=Blastococcus colisei TaxID=1564162 RepID=A0A543P1X1_9ACTN|nr:hypothetical protein [Blastococcus colisei]TQN38116.1 putative lipoprotein with Yx(FWY)xxD motif [Blastococcus colisei]